MNVDWLEDETIFYLGGDDLKKLVNGEQVWVHKEEQIPTSDKERTFSASLHTSNRTTPGTYDDCLLALEEAVAFINTVQEFGVTDGIDGHFDLGKVVRTYEHYKQMQEEYEK